jgi:hypothetical protein
LPVPIFESQNSQIAEKREACAKVLPASGKQDEDWNTAERSAGHLYRRPVSKAIHNLFGCVADLRRYPMLPLIFTMKNEQASRVVQERCKRSKCPKEKELADYLQPHLQD